jgi:uncharacterized protein
MARRYLLSIDGGGIRGIMPALALEKLERTTGRPAREIFSFAAGTSTGALLSAAIAAGVPASRLVDIYLKRGKEIFSPGPPWNAMKRLATGSMYSAATLRRVLADELRPAEPWRLNDSPIDILLTAKGIDGKPWYFVKDKPGANSACTGNLPLLDCATASAAAPTYFNPWTIEGLPAGAGSPPASVLVDGGVGVTGNPVYQACVEAFYYTGEYTPEETTVVSLGTGRFPREVNVPGTLWGWLPWILDELLRSPEEQQTDIVRRHFTATLFYRLNPDIRQIDRELKKPIDMDGIGQIEKLREYGEKFAATIDWGAILDGSDTAFRVGRP